MAYTNKVDMEKYKKEFPTRLRKLLEGNACTQGGLAKAIGLTSQAVGSYTRGETLPTLENAQAIADFFGVSLDYLTGRNEAKKPNTAILKESGLTERAILNLQIAAQNQATPLNAIKADAASDSVYLLEVGRIAKIPFLVALLENVELWEEMAACAYEYAKYKTSGNEVFSIKRSNSPMIRAKVERESAKEALVKLMDIIKWNEEG